MKRLFKAYTSFTRTERMGLAGLCLLLAALVTFNATMPMWTEADPDPEKEAVLVAAYSESRQPAYRTGRQNGDFLKTSPKRQPSASELVNPFEKSSPNEQHPATNSPGTVETGQSEKSRESEVQAFDPNTADSPTLRRFGLRPLAIANLLKWRAKGKRFYTKEDLKPLYTLTNEEYQMLEPYIVIKQLKVNLNTADSVTLVSLRGIGPAIAHKILLRRSTRGPFTNLDQLRELHHFKDEVFEEIAQQLDPLSP